MKKNLNLALQVAKVSAFGYITLVMAGATILQADAFIKALKK